MEYDGDESARAADSGSRPTSGCIPLRSFSPSRTAAGNPSRRTSLSDHSGLPAPSAPLEVGAIGKIVTDIDSELHRLGKAEVESRVVGEMVMERLRELDRVAYIRYASVYRDFEDLDTFAQEVEALRDESPDGPKPQLRLIEDDVPRLTNRGRRRRTRRAASGN